MNKGTIYLILATLFWGTTFSFTKYFLNYSGPLGILAIRFCISSLIIYALFYKKFKNKLNIFKDKLFILFGLCHFLAYFFQTKGLVYTSASNAAFITALACVFVPFLNYFHFKSKISNIHLFSISLAIIGIYILSFSFKLPSIINIGDLLMVFCAILYAYFIILLEHISKKYSTRLIVFYLFTTTGVYSLVFSFKEGINFSFIYDVKALISIILLTIFGTILANLLITKGQSLVKSDKASLIYTLEPIFALIFAVIFINENISLSLGVGASIVVFSLVLSLFFDKSSTLG